MQLTCDCRHCGGRDGPWGAPWRAGGPAEWRKVEWMDEADNVAGHLARNLAALRHARALTQDALAKASGLPRSTIANLESGTGNPSLQVLTKVARTLGVP